MDLVSKILIPKLSPNHVRIGSRKERLGVLKRRKLKNSLRFSFLLLVTRWFADRFRDQCKPSCQKNSGISLFYPCTML